ncbi:MAG: hypothetical protein SU899_03140 [Chloroflexota bacterium]|nr:hypothetical protein [Chloroflexota bacterium]
MRKKTLLIFSVALISLLALMTGAVSMSADDYDYYYAYAEYPSAKAGVSGSNYVYDNDVSSYHVAEFVNVNLSLDPHKWIEVGWTKHEGWNKPKFYVGYNIDETGFHPEYLEDAEYNTRHSYKIYEPGNTWRVYIDGDQVEYFTGLQWSEGDIQAVSESCDSASPPENQLSGYFQQLKYYSPGSDWLMWDDMDPHADPGFHITEISPHRFIPVAFL